MRKAEKRMLKVGFASRDLVGVSRSGLFSEKWVPVEDLCTEISRAVADAQAQLEAALAPFRLAPAAPSPADRYRDMLRDFLDLGNGDLNESAIAELIDFQASNDLNATQVAAIEAEVRRSLAVN